MPVFNVFNYSDHASSTRHAVCSNPIANAVSAAASRCDALNEAERMAHHARLRAIANWLTEDDARDAEALSATLDGHLSPSIVNAAKSIATFLRKKKADRLREEELERIKVLLSSKATIRYRIEVK